LKESEFVVIGGGPGGVVAAIVAARAGVKVTLLDENERPGGQIYRQFEKGFKVTDSKVLGRDYKKGLELLNQLSSLSDRIRYLNNATVWGIFKSRTLAFARNGTSSSLRFKNLLVATGAYDRPVPFPGWTLPGVLTAGGAQRLVKTERVLPGEKILLAGTGPQQLVLAHQILNAGGKIEAILEAGNISKNWLRILTGIWGNWDYLKEGWRYLRHIQKAGVPLLRSHIILEVHGNGQVEEAVIAEVDKSWRPKPDTERTVKVDTVCLGYGLVSSTELTLLAECEHKYELFLGGYIPVRSESMETTVPGIYAVGDGAGVAGSKVAIEEGRIAGVSIARSLGYISDADAGTHIKLFKKRLNKFNRLRKVLDEMSMPKQGLYELAKDDTVLCRCEEITLKEIKEAMAVGTIQAKYLKDLKRMTRVGMGPCEGRMCGPALIEIMRHQPNASPEVSGCLLPRPSIKPISLGVLAASKPEE
jgi:NADPH-dependent 2,4-dienoyl-CoA reductase/sulfur reductase-like enzyme